MAPAMVKIVLWAARYEDTDAPTGTVRATRSNRERFIAEIRKRWKSDAEASA